MRTFFGEIEPRHILCDIAHGVHRTGESFDIDGHDRESQHHNKHDRHECDHKVDLRVERGLAHLLADLHTFTARKILIAVDKADLYRAFVDALHKEILFTAVHIAELHRVIGAVFIVKHRGA